MIMHNNLVKYSIIILILLMILVPLCMFLIPKINYRPMPADLCEAKLSSSKPNWVSSLIANSDEHYITPLQFNSLSSLAANIEKYSPKTHIVHLDQSKLLAYRQSPVFNFTDWICIKADGHVTASATMGYSDFGKNRQWVNLIRNNCP